MKNAKITVAALLLCCLLMTACGMGRKQESAPVPAAATPAPIQTSAGPTMSEAEQRDLIERSRNVWYKQEPTWDDWFYAFTDFDHNGRLEVITASLQGSGLYTYVECWEIGPGFTGLVACPDNTREGEAWPDIIKDTLTVYRDPASGRCTYICEDLMRDGMAHYYTGTCSFCLENGRFELRTLASKDEVYDEQGSSTIRYYDANGTQITMDAYNSAVPGAFAGQEQGTIALNWTKVEARPPENLPSIFETPDPVYQSAQPVTVTKNPTGETVAVGGRAWFIAHADNATSLTWQLVGTDGYTYSLGEVMARYAGVELEALEGDTLAVRNIPAALDGWSVQALFEGPGGYVVTSPAVIRVQDYTSAYGGVISRYFRAYASGATDPGYAFENGISEYIGYSSHVGYALEDLNGDGMPELVIAGTGENNNAGGVICDLYTLVDGQPVQLACSSARDRYLLRTDGSVLNEGSSGAGHSTVAIMRVQGDALVPAESVFTYFDGQPTDGYYHSGVGSTYAPGLYDEAIDEQTYNYYVSRWEESIYVPRLTLIA